MMTTKHSGKALETRPLRLYLQINAGGTPHAPEEIARVRALLLAEEGRS